ncbi:Zn-ribbon domain-containing OB-fold protein [Mycobacterium sp. MUNTM1]
MTASLPTPEPIITPETAPMWSGANEGRLVLPQCDHCHRYIWYPRAICGHCSAMELTWRAVSGKGTVYSYTVVRRGIGDYRACTPYVVAYVELDEGPRMMTNLVDCDIDEIAIGVPVEVVFHKAESGQALPRFRPARTAL